jgi:sec-independent protein translocase protein TatA
MMGLENPIHLIFLMLLLLLLFGAKRLPEMGRSLGTGLRGFKESLSGDADRPSLPAGQGEPLVQSTAAAREPATVAPAATTVDDPSVRRA